MFALSNSLCLDRWGPFPNALITRQIVYGVILGFSLSLTSSSLILYLLSRKSRSSSLDLNTRPPHSHGLGAVSGVIGLIGDTPLVRINSLSDALGVEILGKAEFLNPGGSVKDRVALRMIDDAERSGLLYPHSGSRIFEGTVGSTGISIATISRARGYDTTIIVPDDIAEDKVKVLLTLGADVEMVRPASIVDKKQYVNLARQYAMNFGRIAVSGSEETVVSSESISAASSKSYQRKSSSKPRGYFADQFENRSNFNAHFEGTGPEIWKQTNGHIEAFVSGAGTGGTIAGVGQYLKSMDPNIIIALSDPEGSGLYNKVKHGVMYDRKESEGTRRRHQVDTVVEGIGINRLTKNIQLALPVIDDAFRITDAEAVSMSRYLVRHDGLFLGSSSACNLIACVKLVRKMGWQDGQIVVTILCDSGNRHYSKFWNDDYLNKSSIPIDLGITSDLLSGHSDVETRG